MSGAAGLLDGSGRTIALVLVAVGSIGALVFDQFGGAPKRGPGASPADTANASSASVVLPGAPPGDVESLRQRYRPIVLKGPFKERDFKDRPAPKPREREARDEGPRVPPKPGDLSLRLTSLMGTGADRVGLLEERSSGTAIFAKAGFSLGELSVASVGTDSLHVKLAGKERELALGDSLTLPASAKSGLSALRPAGSVKEERKPVTGTSELPELSDDKKMSILERLKARRQASMKRAGEPEGGDAKPEDAEGGQPGAGEGTGTADPKAGEAKAGDPQAGEPKPGDPQASPGDAPGPGGPARDPEQGANPDDAPGGPGAEAVAPLLRALGDGPNPPSDEPESPSDHDDHQAPPADEPDEPPASDSEDS